MAVERFEAEAAPEQVFDLQVDHSTSLGLDGDVTFGKGCVVLVLMLRDQSIKIS